MAECMYYDTKDIMDILKVGKRKANEIMHFFDQRGQMFRFGKTMRVRKSYFEKWLNENDGEQHSKSVMVEKLRRMV